MEDSGKKTGHFDVRPSTGRGLRHHINGMERTFSRVYRTRFWGRYGNERFFSGVGSLPENLEPYAAFVAGFVREHRIERVVDLGCGDYRASRSIDFGGAHYLGIDVVRELIDQNNARFGSDTVRFARLDLLTDELPVGDLCLLKHVLQHWSNAHILSILPRLRAYRHVLVMDGLFSPESGDVSSQGSGADPNEDIATGGTFRSRGLYLERPPFNCDVEPVLTYRRADDGEVFRLLKLRLR